MLSRCYQHTISFTSSLILIGALIGCSTVKYNYSPEVKRFSIPELEIVTVAGLGEPLLDQGLAIERENLIINSEGSISAYKIKPGKLIKAGEDEQAEYFIQNFSNGFMIYSGLIMSTPDATASIKRMKSSEEFCVMRPTDVTVCGKLDAIKNKEKIITNESFRRTLIYSGRVGNKLKISYREFSNDMARAAFNTDAEYDMNEGGVIGYAGAKIEIIEATNTQIKYKVIKNFNTQ